MYKLAAQYVITLNLLQTYQINPKLYDHSQVFGNFNYDHTPMDQPGAKFIIHVMYALALTVIYNKSWRCLRSDYIIFNILYDIYLLLWPFTPIVVGGGQYYVLHLARYLTTKTYWIIKAVCRLLPALTYILDGTLVYHWYT